MAEYVMVTEESLRSLYDNIQKFKRNINMSLTELQGSTNRLRSKLDELSVRPAESAVQKITRVVDENSPVLDKLATSVNMYADAVARIKELQSR